MQFLLKDILNNKNLHQSFVRTTFLGSPVGTRTRKGIANLFKWFRAMEQNGPHVHIL